MLAVHEKTNFNTIFRVRPVTNLTRYYPLHLPQIQTYKHTYTQGLVTLKIAEVP